ncbi:RNA polymerase sigma factor [Sinomicrobium weinanense]|uniref:Sigma-70 family RNA polymerase sigma factor n=1 Tax=Sinomicrobium weinanense TaxID=2842200 RepID=A0A926JVR3_9FLAO|nr:sigma-70 family RNA polymerase sigma factor [Sinomicrobium weinanense]MBC9798078.1 sigma-70 family RNA polymerase sigma factor [Sinomicrobium weinanense]MBU3122560.1 sigma-70 family RNA polymerase sigma factor [Sinomicrobium weinanense]
MNNASDTVLVKLLSEGNESAFTTLYYRYVGKLRAFLIRLKLDKHMDDIIQETFIIIWKKRHVLQVSRSPEAYIFTIAKNLALKSLKIELQLAVSDLPDTEIPDLADAESAMTREAFHRALEASIEKLPDRPREILILKRIKGLSTEEIARELGISKSTVENHMNRALATLKEELSSFSAISLLFLEIYFLN